MSPAPDPITVVVTFTIREGLRDQFLQALRAHLPNCVAEETCLRMWLHEDPEDPSQFMLFEEWADRREFLDVQLAREYRRPYMAATEPLWAAPRVTTIWRRMANVWDQDLKGRSQSDD